MAASFDRWDDAGEYRRPGLLPLCLTAPARVECPTHLDDKLYQRISPQRTSSAPAATQNSAEKYAPELRALAKGTPAASCAILAQHSLYNRMVATTHGWHRSR
ncbi:MAG TPA: hypothetical protein VLC30_03670 [Pseudomonas sp.]|nr:hypothetical protein [Pseudomonas sp.]